MSTGLDRRDLQKMLHDNMQALQSSPVIARWQKENGPTVSVLPLRNETTEHIDSQLDSLISDIETTLVNAGHVQVISLESQPQLMEQVRKQYQDGFDQSKIAAWGKQIGVRYVVTGKVFAATSAKTTSAACNTSCSFRCWTSRPARSCSSTRPRSPKR